MKKERKIVTAMKDTILPNKEIMDQTVDLLGDNIEIGIDTFIDDEIVKDVPIIGNVVKIMRLADSIHNRHFIIKLEKFVREIYKNDIEIERIEKHRNYLEKNPEKMEKEMTTLLLIIEDLQDKEKIRILSNIYFYYLREMEGRDRKTKECWIDFCILTEILKDISIYDLPVLEYIYKQGKINRYSEKASVFQIARLERCGVVYRETVNRGYQISSIAIKVTPQGELFYILSKADMRKGKNASK